MRFSREDLLQPPPASAMSESLRSLGYTPGAAVADLVDNSLTATARNVWLSLAPARVGSGRRLAILDDGRGMSGQVLLNAMRPGSGSPLDRRATTDLGRFGLGLKTSSFSQCRCLTVASRTAAGELSVLRWDLDHVRTTNRWELLEGPDPSVEPDLQLLDGLESSGTLVLWSKIDRLATNNAEVLAGLRRHLSLTFHQLLESRTIRIHTSLHPEHTDTNPVAPVDPFMRGNEATKPSPTELVDGGCTLRGYVLPHRDRCTDAEWEAGSLGSTWRDRQGCYVYRNRRLLVTGGWLDLNRQWRKDVETQLARLEIEFDNTWDERWSLNVMKSQASPPASLRERLTELARIQREGSIQVFAHRHRREPRGSSQEKQQSLEHVPLWVTTVTSSGTTFAISDRHPAVRALCESAPLARAVLDLVETTLPHGHIWHVFQARVAGGTDTQTTGLDRARLRRDLVSYIDYECANGRTLDQVLTAVRSMAPYDDLPELVDSVAEELQPDAARARSPVDRSPE